MGHSGTKKASCTKSLRDGFRAHELGMQNEKGAKTDAMEAAHLTYSAVRHTILQWQPCAKALFSYGFDSAGGQK
jgi:hypothetical protein